MPPPAATVELGEVPAETPTGDSDAEPESPVGDEEKPTPNQQEQQKEQQQGQSPRALLDAVGPGVAGSPGAGSHARSAATISPTGVAWDTQKRAMAASKKRQCYRTRKCYVASALVVLIAILIIVLCITLQKSETQPGQQDTGSPRSQPGQQDTESPRHIPSTPQESSVRVDAVMQPNDALLCNRSEDCGHGKCTNVKLGERDVFTCVCNDGYVTTEAGEVCQYKQKSKMTAILLQVFLGEVGAGDWFLGRYAFAASMLGLCCCACCGGTYVKAAKESASPAVAGVVLCATCAWCSLLIATVIITIADCTDGNDVPCK